MSLLYWYVYLQLLSFVFVLCIFFFKCVIYLTLNLFVFSFFLEKNMFAFFLNILRQKSGRYVCVQLLQTLNILFENISHETSLCKYLKVK